VQCDCTVNTSTSYRIVQETVGGDVTDHVTIRHGRSTGIDLAFGATLVLGDRRYSL